MINDILTTPQHYKDHIRRYSYSVTAQMIFGFRAPTSSDSSLVRMYNGFENWANLMGQSLALLPDVFPVFKWLPDVLLPVRGYAKSIHVTLLTLFMENWNFIKKRLQGGADTVSKLLDPSNHLP